MLVFNHSASIRAPSRGGSRDGYEEQLCEATCSSESGEGRRPCGQLTLTTGGGAARLGAVTGEAEEPGHHARGPLPGEVSALARCWPVARAGKTTSASGGGRCSGMRCRLGEGGRRGGDHVSRNPHAKEVAPSMGRRRDFPGNAAPSCHEVGSQLC